MPKMFGDEKYAFTLIDIEDPRYVQEASEMGRKLTRLNYEKQIVDMEWRRTYKLMLRSEHHERTLPNKASEKTRKTIEKQITDYKEYLLQLQEQKDQYESLMTELWQRCNELKAAIRQENDLESLRKELTQRVKATYAQHDDFWQTKFSVSSPEHRRPSREWMYNLDD
jgi:hypothetical protein